MTDSLGVRFPDALKDYQDIVTGDRVIYRESGQKYETTVIDVKKEGKRIEFELMITEVIRGDPSERGQRFKCSGTFPQQGGGFGMWYFTER
jgi:hypothetical protein